VSESSEAMSNGNVNIKQLPLVIIGGLLHRNKEWISISCKKDFSINKIIRAITNNTFSASNNCWLVPFTKENFDLLYNNLKPIAKIDSNQLLEYRKNKTAREQLKLASLGRLKNQEQFFKIQAPIPDLFKINEVNKNVLTQVQQHLQLKAYSINTRKTYLNEIAQFLITLKNHKAENITPNRLKDYLEYCIKELRLSENTLHSRINALKFYYEQVLGKQKFFHEIPRAKKPYKLPNVLSEKEIVTLFKTLKNTKHKAILFTAYSAGMRVSEVVSLKIRNIDSERMQIKIEGAKGKKDRYVNLSIVLLDALRLYLKNCNPRPKKYLFESEVMGEPYSSRSAQKVFQRAKEKAGIAKNVTFHSLRHSFATHLLEKGVDIRYIKDILGHSNIKTTERYTHVKKDQIIQISSPLDDLWLKGDIKL